MSNVIEQYYEIYIKGIKLNDSKIALIDQVTFEDNSTGSDTLQITISDPDFTFIDDNFFIEDASVKFIGGFNKERVSFSGFISVIDADFPQDGTPTLTIICMDNSHLLNRVAKSRTWKKTKMSTIARAIFLEHGLKAKVDDTKTVEDTISQSNQTDIEFLINKAKEEINEFICYIEGDTGYYVKRKILATPQDNLDYRSGNGRLFSFSPRINKESKREKITKNTVNAQTGKVKKDETTSSTVRDLQGTSSKTYEKYVGNNTWVKKG
jgi:hypothetical protein